MNFHFYNTPNAEPFNTDALPKERPLFLDYTPNLDTLKSVAAAYDKYQHILVIGHGGSITSFYGLYHALKGQTKKQAFFLSTVDPDYIYELKQTLTPQNTVVVAISKSGETVTQLEAVNQFLHYPLLFVTGKDSALDRLAQQTGADVLEHPAIGGRYTAFSEVGLLPAALVGLPVEDLLKGAAAVYKTYEQENVSWQLASVLWQLEQKGFVDVFMPFYSHALFPMSAVIVQLCHESFGKDGKGQSYMAFEAPESQHHTNQRFFGGTKNIAGLFTSVQQFTYPTLNTFAPEALDIPLKSGKIADINNVPLEKAMEAELQGTLQDARQQGIPLLHMELESFAAHELGKFLATWQLYAVYASCLRGVDPFDQPQVEASKRLSFEYRLKR